MRLHYEGDDLKDDQVKTFVFVCLSGQFSFGYLKQAGIKAGTTLTKSYQEHTR